MIAFYIICILVMIGLSVITGLAVQVILTGYKEIKKIKGESELYEYSQKDQK